MKQFGNLLKLFGLILLLAQLSCTEQHDPTAHHAQIKAEHDMAQREIPKLTKEGKIPAAVSGGEELSAIDKKYKNFCSSCHGMAGDANTPAAHSLNPQPRNFSDAKWQDATPDSQIAKVIKEGGASIGLSATMAPWGAMLSDAEIKEMVAKIRKFKK